MTEIIQRFLADYVSEELVLQNHEMGAANKASNVDFGNQLDIGGLPWVQRTYILPGYHVARDNPTSVIADINH